MSDMELAEEIEETKRCYRIKERLLDSLNIVYNESNSVLTFWNKYQIFTYEDYYFENPAKSLAPEFQVCLLINSNNYLVCLDTASKVHVTSLKFKHSAQKRFRSSLQPREEGILTFTQRSSDTVLCLRYESDKYYLCLHRINSEFQLEKKTVLKAESKHWSLTETTQDKCILYSHEVKKHYLETLKEIFDVNTGDSYNLVLISFDKISVYGCLFNPKTNDECPLIKLYTAPTEICDIKITETGTVNLIIALTIGTIIQLPLKDKPSPDLIHLNTAISKILTSKSNDMLIYSDGDLMYKTENILSKKDIKFAQFFVKNVKDFIKCGEQLVCTTYSNLIYTFSIEDEAAYLKPVSTDEYYAADTLLHNSDYFYSIMKEVDRSNEMNKKLGQEGSYVTALALSKRQDIMERVIKHKAEVFESYEDAVRENPEVLLTEELSKYFEQDTFCFVIKLCCIMNHHTFNDILSNLFGDLKIHINFSSEGKLLKTTSIKLYDTLRKLQVLVPICAKKMSKTKEINIDIKIVTNIPGSFDEKHSIWIVLYRKLVVMKSEHFIKTNMVVNRVASLKEPEGRIQDLIYKAAMNHHGEVFRFIDTTKPKKNELEWTLYVRLPDCFREILLNEGYLKTHFNPIKTHYLLREFSSEEFLKMNTDICFEIGDGKVKVEIVNYFYKNVLKISSTDRKLALNIRSFFADWLHNGFKNSRPGMDFASFTLYATIEDIQRTVKRCINDGVKDEFLVLADLFIRTVYGALPL